MLFEINCNAATTILLTFVGSIISADMISLNFYIIIKYTRMKMGLGNAKDIYVEFSK